MQLGTIARKQRAGLLLTSANGSNVIIVAFAAGAESAPTNHGWVVALSVSPFQIAAAWNDSPHYQGGGIWMGAQGPAADTNGNIYLVSGNGSFDGVTDFGESVIKLQYTPANGNTPASLSCVDWWTPFTDTGREGMNPATPSVNEAGAKPRPTNRMLNMPMHPLPPGGGPPTKTPAMGSKMGLATGPDTAASNAGWIDQDLGSAGVLLMPDLGLVSACGKDGILYVLNASDLGKTALGDFATPAGIDANYAKAKSINWFTYFPGWNISPTPTNLTLLNFFFGNVTHHQHGTPVYYNSSKHGPMLFTGGENGPVRVWSINAQGQITFLAYSDEYASPNAPVPYGGMPGAMLTLCANRNTAGTAMLIVFSIRERQQRGHAGPLRHLRRRELRAADGWQHEAQSNLGLGGLGHRLFTQQVQRPSGGRWQNLHSDL